ncbi:hypothetical protein BKA67DRAFT_665157 [Truncatella angustata]|uniref:Uncharacterized protein n=1 Tax=Truncatella angustata TaxID=152316 RepID=A0A9P8RK02_9PEZI|nr:uncharacterized protein BKA67DRAFT_665157 [Truncatella angustata]KAH6643339.1 hypothetical protein BKA67DRAFT_665157 [Truncatella angustata]
MKQFDTDALELVEKISALQAPVDAAQEQLNTLLAAKHNLQMTKTKLELLDTGIKTNKFNKPIEALDQKI